MKRKYKADAEPSYKKPRLESLPRCSPTPSHSWRRDTHTARKRKVDEMRLDQQQPSKRLKTIPTSNSQQPNLLDFLNNDAVKNHTIRLTINQGVAHWLKPAALIPVKAETLAIVPYKDSNETIRESLDRFHSKELQKEIFRAKLKELPYENVAQHVPPTSSDDEKSLSGQDSFKFKMEIPSPINMSTQDTSPPSGVISSPSFCPLDIQTGQSIPGSSSVGSFPIPNVPAFSGSCINGVSEGMELSDQRENV